MNTHTTLLNQLEAFEAKFGVKVVPRYPRENPVYTLTDGELTSVGRKEQAFWWRREGGRYDYMPLIDDAHAHIREGARKAVEWWCLKYRGGMCITPHDGIAITAWDTGRTLGHGPTTEDALSGALETILKEKA